MYKQYFNEQNLDELHKKFPNAKICYHYDGKYLEISTTEKINEINSNIELIKKSLIKKGILKQSDFNYGTEKIKL